MQGRIYDERTITLYFIPRDLYYQNFKKGLTPPPILDKKWLIYNQNASYFILFTLLIYL